MSGPGSSRITWMLEPANTPQGIILVDLAVIFARSAAVAPAHDVQVPIAIDVRYLQAGHTVRREPANEMCVPPIIDALGLLKPKEPSVCSADDVEPAILIQIRVLEVESGSPGAVDANGMLAKSEAAVSHVLEEHQPALAAGSHDDIQISVAVEIHWFSVLRHAVASKLRFFPVVTDQRIAGHLIDGHGRRPG